MNNQGFGHQYGFKTRRLPNSICYELVDTHSALRRHVVSEKDKNPLPACSDYVMMNARFRIERTPNKPHSRNYQFNTNFYYNEDASPKSCGCPDRP